MTLSMTPHDQTNMPNGIFETVIASLEESVKRNMTAGILLSGGLDTTILAYLASKHRKQQCVTVALQDAPAPDVKYATKVAQELGLIHYIHTFGENELLEAIRETIRVLRIFDPMEVRNSASAYVALKIARSKGLTTVMTGDGVDELFAGYSFFFDMTKEQMDKALKALWTGMNFSSIPLGKSLGVKVKTPFLDSEFKAFAMSLDAGLKIRSERGQIWGKWVLRKAFENMIPADLIWRPKAPLEVGSGTTTLPSFFAARVSDSTFQEKKSQYLSEDNLKIRDKEQLVYYEIYRDLIGVPKSSQEIGKRCPDCGVRVDIQTNYCRTCGAYPI